MTRAERNAMETRAEYGQRIKEIKILLKMLAEEVDKQRRPSPTWASVGFMTSIKEKVREALASMRYTTTDDDSVIFAQIEEQIKERL